MKAMILAAGEGTRLRPLTLDQPKPAISIVGIPLGYFALAYLQSVSLKKIVVNTFYLPEKIKALYSQAPISTEIVFSDEKEKLLGSSGGMSWAWKHLSGGGDFIVINADEVIIPQEHDFLKSALAEHKKSGALASLVTKLDPRVGSQFGGVWCNESLQVFGFGKTNPTTKNLSARHFLGVMIFSDRVQKYLPPAGEEGNILYGALTKAIAEGELVRAHHLDCTWLETGNPKDFAEAQEWLKEHIESNSFLKEVAQKFSRK